MTVSEAVLEMRYSGIPEEDIEEIMELCKKKGLCPQNIDIELEARGFDTIFSFEYDEYESWYEGQSQPAPKVLSKETHAKEKN